MKRGLLCLITALLLSGCSGTPDGEGSFEAFRAQLQDAGQVSFSVEVTADYIDSVERFLLDCTRDPSGLIRFCVAEPEEIRDITGTVSGETGSLSFEDKVLAFPLMIRERISPVSGPWMLLHGLQEGHLTSWVQEGELLHVTLETDLNGTTVTMDVWLRGDAVEAGEIAWQGIRQMTLQFRDFSFEKTPEGI